jgi:hypothetical protein
MPVTGWPAVDIGATGVLGIALESSSAPGTYVAPTKFFPIASETLEYSQSNIERRTIRGVADVIGIVPGMSEIKGDITFELSEDVLPYFLYAGRNNVVKTGSTNFVYVATPYHGALPNRTMSITIVRNGIVFGYTGCVVSGIEYDASDDGIVMVKATMVGIDEATQSAPTPTYATVIPFGPGNFDISIPAGTQVFDMDKFTLTVNDNAVAEHRMQSTRKPTFIVFGERTLQYKCDRDFSSRTEYDNFYKLSVIESGLTVLLTKGANNSVNFNLPSPLPNEYMVAALSGQGTLIRSSVTFDGIYNLGSSAAIITTVNCQESIT